MPCWITPACYLFKNPTILNISLLGYHCQGSLLCIWKRGSICVGYPFFCYAYLESCLHNRGMPGFWLKKMQWAWRCSDAFMFGKVSNIINNAVMIIHNSIASTVNPTPAIMPALMLQKRYSKSKGFFTKEIEELLSKIGNREGVRQVNYLKHDGEKLLDMLDLLFQSYTGYFHPI